MEFQRLFSAVLVLLALSNTMQAESLAEMQKRLNQETISKEFSVEDEAKIDAFIKESMGI